MLPKLYNELSSWWPLLCHLLHDDPSRPLRHIEGLFGRDEWLQILRDIGFQAQAVPFDHSELEPGSYEVFLATKPRA